MMWWRGRGYLIPFVIAFPVLLASRSNNEFTIALAFAVGGGLVYLFKDWLGEGSALYSIPVRAWPAITVVLSVLLLAGAIAHKRNQSVHPVSPPVVVASQPKQPEGPEPKVESHGSGLPAFEAWARQNETATDIRYVSDSEIWISLWKKPQSPDVVAADAATHYKDFMAISAPVKVVIFSENVRLAEATK
jgi:hypothetical protein